MENMMNLKRALIAAAAVAILPASAFAQSTFNTNVVVTPDTGATTTVSITCNGGVPLEQELAGLGNGDNVTFVVAETNDTTDCTITAGGISGFNVAYTGSGVEGSCSFENIGADATEDCRIDFTAGDVSYNVTKIWEINADGDNLPDTSYEIEISCDSEITAASGATIVNDDGEWTATWDTSGTTDRSYSAKVAFEDASGPTCSGSETIIDSAIESVSSGCGSTTIALGGSATCTITNTVFFEGIPTLSQYGMAIMALLMLGVGFVGFRRFV